MSNDQTFGQDQHDVMDWATGAVYNPTEVTEQFPSYKEGSMDSFESLSDITERLAKYEPVQLNVRSRQQDITASMARHPAGRQLPPPPQTQARGLRQI